MRIVSTMVFIIAVLAGSSFIGGAQLRRVLLQRPDAFRTTIAERLIVYSFSGSANSFRGTPESLMRVRQILRSLRNTRWSTLIAAIVREKPLGE